MRTFIAIEIPSTLHSFILQQQRTLAAILVAANQGQSISWTPPTKVHITLRFLGATTDQQRQTMQHALVAISAAQSPFTLALGDPGCFPNRQAPTVIWLAIRDEANTLAPLQQQIEQAAQRAGYAPEPKTFTPHLTIGRLHRSITRPQSKVIGQCLAPYWRDPASHQALSASFAVKHLVYMQSELQRSGSVYTPLEIFDWGKS